MTRSDWLELIFAAAALIAIVLCAPGCASMPEPEWKPDVKVYISEPLPEFVGADKVPMSCSDPLMHEWALISYEKIAALQAKLQRCTKWK